MAASVLSVFNIRPQANSECGATRNNELNLSEKLMTSGAVRYGVVLRFSEISAENSLV